MRNLDNSFVLIIDDLTAAKREQNSDVQDRIDGTIARVRDIRAIAESEGRTGRAAVKWACKNYFWSMTEADEVIGKARRG